ncbi:glycerol kinase GlpK [Companilactobacillus sp. DQM5]|uniref:glycerol kinase GlpK n=1 Tax=Companilactobacillus sp. DQM5 TaxID=3463359 RepID=UPI004057D85D
MKKYILSIDEGTTSTRAVIFDLKGNRIAMNRKRIDLTYPKEGWVEQNAIDIWNSVLSTIATVFIESGIKPDEIKTIGIANQRETTIVWDKSTGLPIYNAIAWQSRQTTDLVNKLINDNQQDMIRNKTGLTISPYFSATKIRWILDKVPGAQEKAEKGELLFGTVNTWILWKLTGGQSFYTDYSNASRTMLFNIYDLTWDKELLDLLDIPMAMLPEVKSNSEIFGKTVNYHFFGSQVPITGMAGSQQAALFGQMAFEKGMTKGNLGTGAFVVMNTGDKPIISNNELLTTIGYGINGKINYALEGTIFVAGGALQWLRDGLKIIKDTPSTEKIAKESANDDELYVVPAFSGLGAPYWDLNARGSIFGITRGTTDKDLVKATLQSLSYQFKDIVDTMKNDSGLDIPLVKVDGGAAANKYLVQFQSDILQTNVQVANELDTTTALGAAFFAGLGVGVWNSTEDIKKDYHEGTLVKPKMKSNRASYLYEGWQNAIEATKAFKK